MYVYTRMKFCNSDGCKKQALYNNQGNPPLYCGNHKERSMINVVTKRCAAEGCCLRPSFNIDSSTKPLYCKSHKTTDMISVIGYKCVEDECNENARYNLPNEPTPHYCKMHRTKDMIDIFARKCKEHGCTKVSLFGDKDTPLYCGDHKKESMVNLVSKLCVHTECNKVAHFNYKDTNVRLYCGKHKKKGMVNLGVNICKTMDCDRRVSSKYKGYCLLCYVRTFPDEPRVRNYKIKEGAVVDFVLSTFPDFTWHHDKRVLGGTSKYRPDILYDTTDKTIIIEVDENQHRKYDLSSENHRLNKLVIDNQQKPIVFIRFNPDNYTINGKRYRSCWGFNEERKSIVVNSDDWDLRLNALRDAISYWTTPGNDVNKMYEVIELFYNKAV
jgi:EsV-1-7 cysteine-rich motif